MSIDPAIEMAKLAYAAKMEANEIQKRKIIERRNENTDSPIDALRSAAYGLAYHAVNSSRTYQLIVGMDCKEGVIIQDHKISDIGRLYCQHKTQCARRNIKPIPEDMLLSVAHELVRRGILMTGRKGYEPSFRIIEESAKKVKISKKSIAVSENAGFVYVAGNGADNAYKIGCTTDLGKRKASLQTSSPNLLSYDTYFKTNNHQKSEKILHQHFFDKHIRGEWFKLSQSDIANIRNHSYLRNLGIEVIAE